MPVWPFRRSVQLLVLALTFGLPIVARYNHYLAARQLDKLEERWAGTPQGAALRATDRLMRIGLDDGEGGVPTRRPRKRILERTALFHGSPWSARIFGVRLTDLLAGAESIAASHTVAWVLILGLAIPLLVTILLGRVYCGWICPMGFLFDIAAKVRTLVRRGLEIRPLNLQIPRETKYLVLAAGLAIAVVGSVPVLAYLYPPAFLSREIHGWVTAQFVQAENGTPGLALVGLTGVSTLILILLLLEVFVAPRFFCRSICPGGALYSLLGRRRLVRVKRVAPACTDCSICNRVCPRGLHPMQDRIGQECDNCGLCLDACPFDALTFRLALDDRPLLAASRTPDAPVGGETAAADSPPRQEVNG